MKISKRKLEKFLQESNGIEGVYDNDSYLQALEAWNYLMTQDEMTAGVVLKTHKILMLHQKLMPDEKGYFRTVPVWVGGREGMDYKFIPFAVNDWCKATNNAKKREWKKLHVEYEKIHPFVDGNGRTGRLFLNWTRVKKLGLQVMVIKESDRFKYYKWFKEDDGGWGDWQAFKDLSAPVF